jgi:hypothetical protein
MEGNPLSGQNDTFIAIEARPAGALMELVGHVTWTLRTGKHRSFATPIDTYAPVHLATDGARWSERDGPTELYGRIGSLDGLAWFFPELPPSGEPGATTEWTIVHPALADMLAVEAARGWAAGIKDAALAATNSARKSTFGPVRLTVRLERWSELAGMRVAELSMSGEEEGGEHVDLPPPMGSMDSTAKMTYRGRYAVLANGRVLRAKVERVAAITLTSTANGTASEPQHHFQRSTHELHLVGACDGPTEASLATPLSREERAVYAWGNAWLASSQNDRPKTLAAFDPALRAKVGDAKLWNALVAYRKLRGENALPPPTFMNDADVEVSSANARVTVRGLVPEPGQNTNHQATLTVTLREVNGAWVVDALRADVALDGGDVNLLEVSRDRVIVRQGWPPR